MDTEALQRRIAERLLEMGITERKASIAATGKPDLIRRIRYHNSAPSADKIARLAEVLGVSVDWLVSGVAEVPPPPAPRRSIAHFAWPAATAPDEVIVNGVRYLPEQG